MERPTHELESERGKRSGYGISTIAIGTGAVDISDVYRILVENGFDGHTTLEIAGDQAVLDSYVYLEPLGAE
ncbi:hypothetical protein BK138_32170 [Paenibacillus rhizosphaerae]|uniref:Uncharacterized protein n=1 Tax=Paenibacillus rhizosphaerae TaxID=297318 RepID=A0A1R1E644_9BACL|nr:hypothetical protein [Paenibacillus rhizosphaerae]OMF47294.1 hypothetical protein BK138_32170 [Paenibacillus rhizosphaerae]